MDMIIQGVALAFMAGLTLYVGSLLVGNLRGMAMARAGLQAEVERLQAEVVQIMDKRRFEREKNELSWQGFRKFVVAKKVPEGGDICSFYLKPHDNKPLPPFHPGQYLTFKLNIPGQSKQTIRCYSLSDSPMPDYYRVSIKRVPRPRDKPDVPPGLSSNHFHDNVQEGDILDVKAPSGHFHIDMTKQTPVVLIGGGVGLTPVMSMLNAIARTGSKRETWFFYGVRIGKEYIMRAHFEQIAKECDNVKLYVCVSDPEPQDKIGGYVLHGRVSVDLFKKMLPSSNFDYYFCGPPPMMESINDGLEKWGVPAENIHYEAFGPATVKKVAHVAAPAADAGGAAPAGIQVTFAKSGKTLTWTSGSLLDLAEANGIRMDSGCRAGNCGTCLTAMQGGKVAYLSPPGYQAEDGSCLACVAKPVSEVKLDA